VRFTAGSGKELPRTKTNYPMMGGAAVYEQYINGAYDSTHTGYTILDSDTKKFSDLSHFHRIAYAGQHVHAFMTDPTGTNVPFSTVQPSLVIVWIIRSE
jgi:hypothetical protein